jgi:hypothetical protein
MNTQLQQAMAAVKAEPNNADAWYLLSQAVPTEKEQAKMLRKVLALNPNHREAQERLAQLTAAEAGLAVSSPVVEAVEPEPAAQPTPIPVSTNPLDFLAQAEADTIPPWMAGDAAVMAPRLSPGPAAVEAGTAEPAPKDIPGWLSGEPSQEWLEKGDGKTGQVVWKAGQQNGQEEAAETEAAPRPAPAPAKPTKAPQAGSLLTSNFMLVILSAAAFLVLAAIIFVFFQM